MPSLESITLIPSPLLSWVFWYVCLNLDEQNGLSSGNLTDVQAEWLYHRYGIAAEWVHRRQEAKRRDLPGTPLYDRAKVVTDAIALLTGFVEIPIEEMPAHEVMQVFVQSIAEGEIGMAARWNQNIYDEIHHLVAYEKRRAQRAKP